MRVSNLTTYFLMSLVYSQVSFGQTNITKELETKLLKNKPKSTTSNFAFQNIKVSENEHELLKSLKRYEIVIAKETRPENIFAIELNRTVCYLQLARINRIKAGGKKLDPVEENYLRKATSTIDKLLKYEKLNNEAKSQLKYFQGIAMLDLGMKEISRSAFEAAIELNQVATYVPSLSLYLADLLYDESELEKAKVAYKRFYDRLTIEEKNLADYKVAWINLNQSKIDEALEIFVRLIQESKSTSIVQDSSLSLAVAWADKYQEDEILQKITELKASEEKKIKILQSVYDSFLKSPNRTHRKIWERILKFEIKEEGVTKLLSNELELLTFKDKINSDIEFMSVIVKYVEDNFELIKKYQKINLKALGQDLENLISKLSSLYQSQKNDQSYAALSKVMEIYLKFNEFDHQVDIASAYIDLLTDQKESDKLVAYCYEVIKNPKLKSLKNKAKLLVLIDLENKFLKNPGTYQVKFFNLVRVYLEDAKADQWQAVATKFYSYLINAKNFEEAEAYINLINKVFPSEDSFLKLISVKFEQKKCSEIISSLAKREKLSPELTDYKRECYLMMASESKKDLKNYITYKKYINEFIQLADEKKKDLAESDFLLTSSKVFSSKDPEISKNISKEEYEELLNIKFFDRRFREEFFPLYQYKIDQYIELGNYDELNKLLDGCDKNKNCLPNLKFLQKVNAFKQMDSEVAADQVINLKLDNDNLPYVSLLNPELIIDKAMKNDVSIDKKYLLVSSRLVGVDIVDDQNKFLYEKLETILSKDELKINNVNCWKVLNNLKLPEFKTRHKLKDTEVLSLMTKVQKTRAIVLNELGTVSFTNQKLILQKAIESENKIAQIINLSPIPKSLDSSKKSEYEEGLKQLSEEFVKQAEAYNQALAKVEEQVEQKNKEKEDLSKLKFPLKKEEWKITDSELTNSTIENYIENKKFYTAFFYLDYLNAQSKLSPNEYFYWRSYILFMSANNRGRASNMINYVYGEFSANKLDELINNWKSWSRK